MGWLVLLFLPYAAYDYLLQLTATLRYSIPVLPMLAAFAAVSVGAVAAVRSRVRALAIPAAALAYVVASAFITLPALVD